MTIAHAARLFTLLSATVVALSAENLQADSLLATLPVTTQPTSQATNPHEQLWSEILDWSDGLTDLMTGVKDKETAQAVAKRLEQAASEGREFGERSNKFGPIGPDLQKAMLKKYGERVQSSMARFSVQMERICKDPVLNAEIGGRLKAIGIFGSSEAPKSSN